LNVLYDNNIPKKDSKIFNEFIDYQWVNLKKNLTEDTKKHLFQIGQGNLISDLRSESLPNFLCKEYLKTGIDHVLIGMKNVKYVHSMKELFNQI